MNRHNTTLSPTGEANVTSFDDGGDYDETAYTIRAVTQFCLMAVIIPVGLIFNSTALVVFLRSTSLRKATSTHFLIALVFADSTYLIGK